MEQYLTYFRLALTDPLCVPPWSEWWTANEELVQRVFPLMEYVRLKHRRLNGARQLMSKRGEEFELFDPLFLLSCPSCGERTTRTGGVSGGMVLCPICGVIVTYTCGPIPRETEGRE